MKAASKEVGIGYKALLQRINRGKVKYAFFGDLKVIPQDEVDRLKKEFSKC